MTAASFAETEGAGVHLVTVGERTLPTCHVNHINLGGQVDNVFVVVSALDFLLLFQRGIWRRVLLVRATARRELQVLQNVISVSDRSAGLAAF